LLALCPVIWIGQSGYVRNLNAGFVWDAADGFSIFNLQSWDQVTGSWRPEGKPALQSLVAMQIEPLLRGYFKLNDWQKMNGNLNIKVTKVIPVVLPVTLGGEELALQDPDQTPLMKAVVAGDLNAVQQLLSDKSSVNINALDQGGETALILACQSPKPKPEIIKALLAAGADVNLRSRTGYTALTWALVRNNNDVSRILRRAGARR
jgi:ankyrin repeat protein